MLIFRVSSGRRGAPDPAAADWERYGDAVEVRNERLIGYDDACQWADACDPPLRGGVKIGVEGAGSCTAGFVAAPNRPVTAADREILTAGHCGKAGDKVAGYTAADGKMLIGSIDNSIDDGPVDAASVPVFDGVEILGYPGLAYWKPRGWIYHDIFTPAMAVRGKATARDSFPVGFLVCRTGYASGVVCGEIISQNGNPQPVGSFFNLPGTNYGMLETNLCSAPGDSGGPVYDWEYNANNVPQATAIGLHSQSEVDASCADGEHSFHTYISDAEARLDVRVLCPNGCWLY